jgi:phage tail-like protein
MAVKTEFLPMNYAQKWNWSLTIGGYEKARFLTADRPKASFEVMEVNPGGTHRPVKQPGRLSFDDLTFERGEIVTLEGGDFIEWMNDCLSFVSGNASKDPSKIYKDVDLIEYDNSNKPINRWTLHGAFISNYDGNDLDGSSSDNKTESLTLTYQYFTRRKLA